MKETFFTVLKTSAWPYEAPAPALLHWTNPHDLTYPSRLLDMR